MKSPSLTAGFWGCIFRLRMCYVCHKEQSWMDSQYASLITLKSVLSFSHSPTQEYMEVYSYQNPSSRNRLLLKGKYRKYILEPKHGHY
jgi:hypothetical protein